MYIMREEKPELANMQAYEDHTEEVICGDDELIGISDEVSEVYNCLTIAKHLIKFNFIYTDASKKGNIPYSNLEEVIFLKRGFKQHPDGVNWLAPLLWEVVQEIPLWIHKGMDKKDATLLNFEQALRLAYGHGQQRYDNFKETLNLVLRQNKQNILALSWFELDFMVWSKQGYVINDYFN
jgi:hypothetical protein